MINDQGEKMKMEIKKIELKKNKNQTRSFIWMLNYVGKIHYFLDVIIIIKKERST